MREIKFRAWDKENEVMIYPKGILFDGRVVNFSCGILEPFEGYELMQYTGLKDKNGKEIYEGDIVKHAIWGDVYEIMFEDGGFYVLSSYDFQTINEYPLEVIGNIFQDGDLLRDS